MRSGTSDEKSQCQGTSADTMKHPITSEKKSCKRLAFMATPKKQSRVTSIDSDSGSPTAFEQNYSEQDSSPSSDRDSSQDDSSDNSGAELETPQDDSQINGWDRFQHRRDSPEDSQESDSVPSSPPSIIVRQYRFSTCASYSLG